MLRLTPNDKRITMFKPILLTTALISFASMASADVIAERKAGFKGNAQALKTIKAALSTGDLTPVVSAAESVADWSARMLDYFPEGSDQGDTKARAEIWFDFEDFTAKAKNAETAALSLVNLAKSGDASATAEGFKALAGTCKACHSSYKD